MAITKKKDTIFIFRGSTAECAALPVQDKQLVFDVELKKFYVDTGNSRTTYGDAGTVEKLSTEVKRIADQVSSILQSSFDEEKIEAIVKNLLQDYDVDFASSTAFKELTQKVETKQNKFKYIEDILSVSNWDLYKEADEELHEYHYYNASIPEGAKINITPIINTPEEMRAIGGIFISPTITEETVSSKKYYTIKSVYLPTNDIKIFVTIAG